MIPEDISVELWTFVGSELAPRNCTSSWWFGNSRSQDCYHFAQDTGGVMEAEFRSAGNAIPFNPLPQVSDVTDILMVFRFN